MNAGIRRAALGFALAAVIWWRPVAATQSLCAAGQQVVFACSVGAKLVSVCASGDLTAGVGLLNYRFGPPGKPEMTYPDGPWRELVRSGTWMFSGGGGAWLAFHRDSFRYIVYTAIGRGWGEKSGVAVEQNGKVISNLPCRDKPTSELGPEFFSKAGIPNDHTAFDLP
jgi:hypothetical protein